MRNPVFWRRQGGTGTGDFRIIRTRDETAARPGGKVDDELTVPGADTVENVAIVVGLHGRPTGLGIAHVDMHAGGAGFGRAKASLGYLFGRDRQMRRHLDGAIRHAPGIGGGHGPLNHFWRAVYLNG